MVKAALTVAASLAALACASSSVVAVAAGESASPAAPRVVQTQSSPAPFGVATAGRERSAASKFQDVIVAGGLDGRVYAINAWTGDTLWTFDSGGPMVDSSSCFAPSRHQQQQRYDGTDNDGAQTNAGRATATLSGEDDPTETADERSVIEKRPQSSAVAAASTAMLAELVPSYDGRLYHLSKAKIQELEMTMLDIINANGPVRLEDTGPDGENLSDIILFGEKTTEIFALDAANGLIQPYYPVSAPSPAVLAATVLFGRAEFTTRAVHARNASSTRCFKIAEYFLQFADQPRCSKGEEEDAYLSPEILVLPKDPDASEDDEGSTIAAYDPWTNKQLWELEIPHFDVLAVYGVSATRGATFFQWSVDGPSSRAAVKRRDLALGAETARDASADASVAAQQQLPVKAEPSGHHHHHQQQQTPDNKSARSKHVARVVSRDWVSMEAQFRLRLLGENYYLESSGDDGSSDVASTAASSTSFGDRHMDELFPERLPRGRKRRVFWEPIENDGKRGVFITYYHVGAMMVGVAVGCLLIAWGCYVKGLSASIAHNAIKSMDANQFFMTHIHQLTIERPGEENITISSVIGRPMLMAALEDARGLPLLENGEESSRRASGVEVEIDPVTEAEMMKRFAQVAAIKAASALTGSTYSVAKTTLLELEYDASADDRVDDAPTESSALVVRSRGVSLAHTASSTRVLALTSSFDADASSLSDDVVFMGEERRVDASIVELDSSTGSTGSTGDNDTSDDSSDSEAKAVEALAASANDASSGEVSVESSDKSEQSSWSSDTGSCESSSEDGDDSTSSAFDASVQSSSASSISSSSSSKSDARVSVRKDSNASSSDSSHANEAEVLFPFVCQSRFANEFEEISAIGKGGFGQVILAENRLDGRKYAIKRVGLHLKNQTSKTLQKFLREVKILALLDHPNIVRYYQAWLEKVEDSVTGLFGAPSVDSSVTGGVPGRNYSMSNLLAPISEMEFSENQRSQMRFFSDDGGLDHGDDDDDGGFEWERDSTSTGAASDEQAWREEDLVQSNVQRRRPRRGVVAPNAPRKQQTASDEDDLSNDKCDHWLYIQMQYCAGRNLGDYLALPNRSMHLPKLLKIFVQIASALAHVHSCGLIHRDLKPANIFVADTDGDSIKLGDFGLSRYAANVNLNGPAAAAAPVDEHQQHQQQHHQHQQLTAAVSATATASLANGHHVYSSSVWSVSMSNVSENEVTAGVGTYLYASPEQVAGKKYNAKTDVYSLGMILFELCHERFTTTMERYIALRNARENTFPPEFRWNKQSPELMAMIAKLLSHDPAARPSADDVVKWGQELYELSLSQHAMAAMRSPLHASRAFGDMAMPSFDLMAAHHDAPSSAFSFHVEAKTEACGGESGSACGERRLPNHDLLKEICDVIARVGNDRVEIKKCGLQLQDGVQILEFVLDAPSTRSSALDSGDGSGERRYDGIVAAIEALPGVEQVRRLGA